MSGISKWFRAEAHGPTRGATRFGVSAWYLTFDAAVEIGTAYIAEGSWSGFNICAVYSVEEPA